MVSHHAKKQSAEIAASRFATSDPFAMTMAAATLVLGPVVLLTACVQSNTYYTTDDPTSANEYQECHFDGAIIRPTSGAAIQASSSITLKQRDVATVTYQFYLNPGWTFTLLDRQVAIVLPDGSSASGLLQPVPGDVVRDVVVTNDTTYAAPDRTLYSEHGYGPVRLAARIPLTTSRPASLTLLTPRYRLNGFVQESQRVPVHLESRVRLDLCEG